MMIYLLIIIMITLTFCRNLKTKIFIVSEFIPRKVNNRILEINKNDTLNDIINLNEQYAIIGNIQLENLDNNKIHSHTINEEKIDYINQDNENKREIEYQNSGAIIFKI